MDNSVSVIIPTYNRSGLVVRAVRSALAAMSPGDELLVIDDGSTDDTAEVLRQFGGAIRYVRVENSGPGPARNLGIRLAKGPLVTFLDSDDEWEPDKLALQRKVMDAFPQAVYCFSNAFSRSPEGETTPDMISVLKASTRVGCADTQQDLKETLGPGVPFSSLGALPERRADFAVHVGDIYFALMEVFYVWTSTIMVRKDVAGASFQFAEDLRIAEDWECFARLAKIGPVAYLDRELAVQISHGEARLTGTSHLKQSTGRLTVLHRVWGADQSFLTAHSARYQTILKRQHLRRAKLLIMDARLKEAREDLKVVGGHWHYRLLASLPPSAVATLLRARRKMGKERG
jgi:glycosyltransferase involved in cell wall biosynthesis